ERLSPRAASAHDRGPMPRPFFAVVSFLALAALGCGPALPPISAARGGDEEEEGYDEEAEDEEDVEGDGGEEGFVDAALLREGSAPIELGEPVEVPGTGVTMRPPEGATPIPFGAGFLSMRHRVQISVV